MLNLNSVELKNVPRSVFVTGRSANLSLLWRLRAMYAQRVGELFAMKTQVKALVVGGGAVGTSIAYHLGKRGWDTMLIERDELTSGSTWHAAGLLPLFNMSYATTHIHKYSVDFYKGLEATHYYIFFIRPMQQEHSNPHASCGARRC